MEQQQLDTIRLLIYESILQHAERIDLGPGISESVIEVLIRAFIRRPMPNALCQLVNYHYDQETGLLTLFYDEERERLEVLKDEIQSREAWVRCELERLEALRYEIQSRDEDVSHKLKRLEALRYEIQRKEVEEKQCSDISYPCYSIKESNTNIPNTQPLFSYLPKIKTVLSFAFFRPKPKVYASVFAPAEVKSNDDMLVQVILHRDNETEEATRLAKAADSEAEVRNYEPLAYNLRNGDHVQVDFCVKKQGKVIHRDRQEIIWRDSISRCTFYYPVPLRMQRIFVCEIGLYIKGVRVSTMIFKTEVTSSPRKACSPVESKMYKNVFISYAHQDQEKADRIADVYEQQGINYFLDQRSFESGDYIWEVISKRIAESDAYILLWTMNSEHSEAVSQERQLAMSYAYPQIQPEEKATLRIFPYKAQPHAPIPQDMMGYWFEDFDKSF